MKFADLFFRKKSKVVINGKHYTGNNVVVTDQHIIIDGQVIESSQIPDIRIEVHGDAESIESTSGKIIIHGNAGNTKTVSGDVACGNVINTVTTTSGDVSCKNIGGNVRTVSGNVHKLFF